MSKLNKGAILILFVIAYLCYKLNRHITQTSTPSLKISVAEARARRFGLIIDVRTPKERELLGYYPESIPISINSLVTEVPLDISSKSTNILVYSNGDNRAQIASEIIYNMGYYNVKYITKTYYSLMPGSSE